MKNILAHEHRELLKRFSRRNTLLAFDYDGTLAPIVSDPTAAHMRPETRKLLTRLARRYAVGVITGRSRADVLQLMGEIPVTEVIGNHGFESAGVRAEHYVARVTSWQATLQKQLSQLPALMIENKRYSLAIHYRNCTDPVAVSALVRAAAEALGGSRLIGGKAVLNVVPDDAPNKGIALLRLGRQLNCSQALYVGDDDTDEDVFALERSEDLLGIRIGQSSDSAAEYFLADQAEVDKFLATVLELGPGEQPS